MQIIDFADDIRLVGKGGSRDRLFATVARLMALFPRVGICYQTKEGKCGWLHQSIRWLGLVVNVGDVGGPEGFRRA